MQNMKHTARTDDAPTPATTVNRAAATAWDPLATLAAKAAAKPLTSCKPLNTSHGGSLTTVHANNAASQR